MIHLCFDTSTDTLSIALFKEASIIVDYTVSHPRQHASLLVPKILEIFTQTPYTLLDVSSISVGVGPGSFTGSRIACSTAQGFSFARNIPLCGVSLFQAMGAYVLSNFSIEKEATLFIFFEDSLQKVVYGQLLSQDLLPSKEKQGEPSYFLKQEVLDQKMDFSFCTKTQALSIICAPDNFLDSLEFPASCSKVELDAFWERPAYWIGRASFLLKEQKKCGEVLPLYVRPSYVDPSFKKTSFS